MKAINDNDLILYHYQDGLDAARMTEIAAALAGSAHWRERYRRLCHVLDAATDEPPLPSDGFEQRLWSGLDQRIEDARPRAESTGFVDRMRGLFELLRGSRLVLAGGFACALLIALGVGFQFGRVTPSQAIVEAPAEVSGKGRTMASRVLDGYVSGHLRATEGLLLTAVNEDDGEFLDGNRELAKSLIESNRLYAAAAARAGNARMADFLRQLEPVLLEVANQSAASNVEDKQGLRDYLQKSDLLFQVRATESRIDVASKRSL
ncbi:hypothetical protein [Dokdonella sp.]|uniref:hypothetical protein n=1 Tax=Dokdonella sp. TaxID=2291710 RepID=UPI003C44D26B